MSGYCTDADESLAETVDEWLADLDKSISITFWLGTFGEMLDGLRKLRKVFPCANIMLDFETEDEDALTVKCEELDRAITRVCEGMLFKGWTVDKAREELDELAVEYYQRNYEI